MGVYDGILRAKREKVHVQQLDFLYEQRRFLRGGIASTRGSPAYRSFADKGYRFVIAINKFDRIDNRIRTLIHEFLHFSDEFVYDLWENMAKIRDTKNFPLEKRIESQSQQVYRSQPVLAGFLKRWIQTGDGDVGKYIEYRKSVYRLNIVSARESARRGRTSAPCRPRQLEFDFTNLNPEV